ncbi:MAG TPA: DUF3667 domain-containing protein [Steroidobacteraceae bacterium]|nr:DUF3667 domain-containing protein [Steroidobacteraceae bacterium]
METNLEAAGDAVTGVVVAQAVGDVAKLDANVPAKSHAFCANCLASVGGKFCANCGQATHLHRSLLHIGHDILHGVFHFEGRLWHTLPELIFKPGRLTRRYIQGERARFVAPLPLFLFTVFLTFAIFSFTSGSLLKDSEGIAGKATENFQTGNQSAIESTRRHIESLREQLAAPGLSVAKRAELESDIAGQESAQTVMEAMSTRDWKRLVDIPMQGANEAQRAAIQAKIESDESEFPGKGSKWYAVIDEATKNPNLLLYKVKTNTYKFSWALIPVSVPFMWLLFFWRRDIHAYDHAIFVTYSLSFMMMLAMAIAVASAIGVSGGLLAAVFGIVAPLHLYKQLRQAYGASRFGAWMRVILLSGIISAILVLFVMLLFTMGILS